MLILWPCISLQSCSTAGISHINATAGTLCLFLSYYSSHFCTQQFLSSRYGTFCCSSRNKHLDDTRCDAVTCTAFTISAIEGETVANTRNICSQPWLCSTKELHTDCLKFYPNTQAQPSQWVIPLQLRLSKVTLFLRTLSFDSVQWHQAAIKRQKEPRIPSESLLIDSMYHSLQHPMTQTCLKGACKKEMLHTADDCTDQTDNECASQKTSRFWYKCCTLAHFSDRCQHRWLHDTGGWIQAEDKWKYSMLYANIPALHASAQR